MSKVALRSVERRARGKIHCSDLCGALTESKRERIKLFGLLHQRNDARKVARFELNRRQHV